MKTCSICYSQMDDNATFCPNCGASVPTVAKKRGGSKKGLIIGIAAAVLVLAIAAAVVITSLLNKPMVQFYRAESKLMTENIGGADYSIESFLRGKAELPSQDVSTDAVLKIDAGGFYLGSLLSKFDISMSVDRHDNSGIFSAAVGYNGSPVISGTVSGDENGVGFYFPELEDKYYYADWNAVGVDREAMFGGETVEFETVSNLSRAYDGVAKRYGNILRSGVSDSDFTRGKAVRHLDGLDIDVSGTKVIVFKPNGDRAADMLRAFAQELRGDEELSNYLLSLLEHYFGREYVNMLCGSALRSSDLSTDAGLLPLFEQLAEELEGDADSFGRDLDDLGLNWTVVIKGGSIIAQYIDSDSFKLSYENVDRNFYIDLRPSEGEGSLTVRSDLTESRGLTSGVIAADLVSGDANIHVEIKVENMDESKKSVLGVRYGSYDLTFRVSGVDFEVPNGLGLSLKVEAGANGGTSHILSVNGLGSLTEGMLSSIKLTLDTTDAASTVREPSVQRTVIADEEEFEEVVYNLGNKFEELLENFMYTLGAF